MNEKAHPPYQDLGKRLKGLREKLHESVAEVSGAVEIEETLLTQIEQGQRRPSEDILMLLMSHFDMPEDESAQLWELAGYDKPRPAAPFAGAHHHDGADDVKPHLVMVVQSDTRVLYSDMLQVSVNDHGVVLQFMQTAGNTSPQTVSRIGLSYEHAESVVSLLRHSLDQAKNPPAPKLLREPENLEDQA